MRLPLLFALLACALPALPQEAPAPAAEPGLYATLTTSLGALKIKLFEQETPITVKNFVDLALGRKSWRDPKTGQLTRRPLYAGTTFHRVMPGFMIQGGDPAGTGRGGTAPIKDEFVPAIKFDKPGRLAMANTGNPNTGSCQFFITEVPTPHLNNQHTIFGQVVEGMDVVTKIANVPKAAGGERPLTPVKIVGITFKREGPAPADDVLAPPKRPLPKKK